MPAFSPGRIWLGATAVRPAAKPVSYTHLDVYKRQVLPFGQPRRPSYWRIAVYCVASVAFCMVFFWPASPVVSMLPPPVLLGVQGLLMLAGFGAAFWLTKAQL